MSKVKAIKVDALVSTGSTSTSTGIFKIFGGGSLVPIRYFSTIRRTVGGMRNRHWKSKEKTGEVTTGTRSTEILMNGLPIHLTFDLVSFV